MGPRPINLPTASATPKLFVIDFRERFEVLNYVSLGNLSQRRVAAKAPREGSDGTKKIKTTDHFNGLFVNIL